MEYLSALLLGVIEGLTEFLPISSTGHLILLGDLIGFQGPPGKVFEIVIQLGAILAVVIIYWRKLLDLALHCWRPGLQRFYVLNLLLAFLPAMVLGATLHKVITEVLFSPWVVSVALILGGIAIILIERERPPPTIHSVPEMGPLAALLVGFGRQLGTAYPMDGARIVHRCHVGPQDRRVDVWRAAVGLAFACCRYKRR